MITYYIKITAEGYHNARVGSMWKAMSKFTGCKSNKDTTPAVFYSVTDDENSLNLSIPVDCAEFVTEKDFRDWNNITIMEVELMNAHDESQHLEMEPGCPLCRQET